MNIIEAVEQCKNPSGTTGKWTVSDFCIRRLDTGDARFAFW